MEENIYLCTRPRLASHLMAAGFVGKAVPNPWKSNLTAWEFEKTSSLMDLVFAFKAKEQGGETA